MAPGPRDSVTVTAIGIGVLLMVLASRSRSLRSWAAFAAGWAERSVSTQLSMLGIVSSSVSAV